MIARPILSAALAGALSFGAVSASQAASDDEAAAAMVASQSLADAVRSAEAASGGKAFEATMDVDDGVALHEVSTIPGDVVTDHDVDPKPGEVVRSEDEGFLSEMIGDDDVLTAFGNAQISLVDAIEAAEGALGGRAVEADLDDDETLSPIYHVEVAQEDGTIMKAAVDGVGGEVLKTGVELD